MSWREELHPREPEGTRVGGRFRFKSGPAAGLSSTRSLARQATAGVAQGGFTIHPFRGGAPTTGYQVAVQGRTEKYPASVLDDEEALAAIIFDHRENNAAVYRRGGRFYLGGWVNEGQLWLEPSERVATLAEAMRLGRERNQIEVWDNARHRGIPTGGTGE